MHKIQIAKFDGPSFAKIIKIAPWLLFLWVLLVSCSVTATINFTGLRSDVWLFKMAIAIFNARSQVGGMNSYSTECFNILEPQNPQIYLSEVYKVR